MSAGRGVVGLLFQRHPGPRRKRGGLVRTGTQVGVWVLHGGNRGVWSAGPDLGRRVLAQGEFVKAPQVVVSCAQG